MDWTDFLRAGVNLGKPKVRFQWIWVDVVKIGRGYLVHENLKSAKWVYELSLFFVCWLWLTFMLTFKCHFTAVLLVRPLAVAGRILGNRVCPSLPPDICLGVFLKLDLRFLWILAWCQKPLRICPWQIDFMKKVFAQKIAEMGQKSRKIVFWILRKKYNCIYSILKIFICCVPAQILWEKFFSWDRGQIPVSQSDCRIPKLSISPEQIDETVSFLSCWYGQSGCRTLKLN